MLESRGIHRVKGKDVNTFQVELEGKVTAYKTFLYEVEAESGAEAIEKVQNGEGKLIEEAHSETIDSDTEKEMTLRGVWDEGGNDA